jgi:hypothetical protein
MAFPLGTPSVPSASAAPASRTARVTLAGATELVRSGARQGFARVMGCRGAVRVTLRLWAGQALNALGVPGVLQPGTYESGIGQATVRITLGPLFTIVTVNGVDVYLHRFTGAIDGVGFSVATGCIPAGTPGRERCTAPPVGIPAPAQS